MREGEDVSGKASMKLGNGEKGKGREGRLRGRRKEKGWRGKGDRRVGGALVLPCSCRWQSRRPLETSRVSLARPSGLRK